MRNRHRFAALFASTLLTGPALSVAAVAQADTSLTIEEIVVTARGRTETVQSVPISETVFSASLIQDAGIDRVDDFFAMTPGVTFANSQDAGTNFISIRGSTQSRNTAPPVAIVIDGVLLTNERMFDQPLFDLSSIEVLRGPQGALYGRNAIGGAIIINTKGPTNAFEGYAQATAGNGDSFGGELSVSGAIVPDVLKARVSAHYFNRDGFFHNPVVDERMDYQENIAFRGHLEFTPAPWLQMDLRGSLVRTKGGGLNYVYQPAVLNDDGIPVAFDFSRGDANEVSRTFYTNNLGRDDRDVSQISLRIAADLGFAELRTVTAYDMLTQSTGGDQYPYSAASGITPAIPYPLGDQLQSQFTDVSNFSQEVRLISRADQRFRWQVGAYFLSENRFLSTSVMEDREQGFTRIRREPVIDPTNPLLSFIADDNDNEAYAVFFSTAFDVTERLEIDFSGRYDREERDQVVDPDQGNFIDGTSQRDIGQPGAVNQATFDLFQPKVSLRYAITDDVSAYASYARGFRSGQFNQNGIGDLAAANGVPGVADVLPQEENDAVEAGFKSVWLGDRLTVNGAVYRNRLKNAPYYVFIGAVGGQVLVPIDVVEIYGGEAEISVRPFAGFDISAGIGVTDATIKDYTVNPALVGNTAPYVADVTFNLAAQYRFDITEDLIGFARTDYERRGEQYWSPENATPRSAINLVNLRAGVETADGHWALTGSVENLTDTVYNSEYVLGGFAHAALPRVWRFDLRYNF
ncbi:iron complex outermembrane receptor protein [Rhodothalassium salexigens DSM 2132]|uniref:Iron complex outermembrane receptor protein n=1 Tax=Rhodothalassium salexigens DSM 2132 TaxID=1188247 RepID=A0A4R2PAD6_RHOSA|nr:TonB-dependent receptor [Rhodothalassium salexigens]MBB4212346.1 iron complex outermembrane receptor protein [Rhodothalassium salexigens DSM 2132]MBK1637770.1 TonB-dependent receptor [Rhodothalassium salexigens DSM 2132]TCP32023.1 iron complex outermembrane receptor protein [Rhodothalassium salexigens DSM 2132]